MLDNLRKSFADHERVNKYSGSIQSIVVSLAVLIGGGWTLMEFTRLHHVEIADAEVATLRKALAEVELRGEPLWGPDSICLLTITAAVKNQGSRKLVLDFKQPALALAYVDFDSTFATRYADPWSLRVVTFDQDRKHVIDLPSSELVPGELTSYSFVTAVSPASLVIAEFKVPVIEVMPHNNQRAAKETWYWTGRRYLSTCTTP